MVSAAKQTTTKNDGDELEFLDHWTDKRRYVTVNIEGREFTFRSMFSAERIAIENETRSGRHSSIIGIMYTMVNKDHRLIYTIDLERVDNDNEEYKFTYSQKQYEKLCKLDSRIWDGLAGAVNMHCCLHTSWDELFDSAKKNSNGEANES